MRKIVAFVVAVASMFPIAARAQVIKFDILERSPAFSGRSFGDVGPYERITARATIALDPADDRNAVITDLTIAPRNAEGRVAAQARLVSAWDDRQNRRCCLQSDKVRTGA